MKRAFVQTIATKVIRITAYLSTLLQWCWILILILPPLIASGVLDALIKPQNSEEFIKFGLIEPTPIVWLFVCIITAAMLLLTVVMILRLPRTILHTGEKFVHHTTDAVVPVLIHHKKIPAKKRRELTRRFRLLIQLSTSFLALTITLFIPQYEDITKQIIITLGLLLAVISSSSFVVAWLIEPRSTYKTTSRTR